MELLSNEAPSGVDAAAKTVVEIELRPAHALHFGGSCQRQDGDLKCPRALRRDRGKLVHERRQVFVVHGLVAAPRGPAPPLLGHDRLEPADPIGGVILRSQIVGNRGIQNLLDDLGVVRDVSRWCQTVISTLTTCDVSMSSSQCL
jgi:hypothetical protein